MQSRVMQYYRKGNRTHITERRRRDFRNPKLAESGKPDLKMPLSTIAKFSGGTNISSALCGGDASAERDIWPLQLSSFMVLAPKHWTVKGAMLCRGTIQGISSLQDLMIYIVITYIDIDIDRYNNRKHSEFGIYRNKGRERGFGINRGIEE